MKIQTYLAIMLLFLCTSVSASGYVSVGYGKTDYDHEWLSDFDEPTATEFHLGYNINPFVSVELGYIDFGESKDDSRDELTLEADSLALSAVLNLRKPEGWFGFQLQLGVHKWNKTLKEGGTRGLISALDLSEDDDGFGIVVGSGITAHVTDNISFGTRFNSYYIDGDNVSRLTLFAKVGF
jgi:hypothetical protein